MSDPRFKEIDYAAAWGELAGKIQWLTLRAQTMPLEYLRTDIMRASLEERQLRERIEAQQKANLDSPIT